MSNKENTQVLPENSMLVNHKWVGKGWRFEITIPSPDCKDNTKMENLHSAMGELGYMLDEILVGAGYEKRIYKSK